MRDEYLRRRLWRKLESLPDERLYQVMDYVDFLAEKYGHATTQPDTIQRLAEGVQDRLRGRTAPWAFRGVMGALNVVDRAMGTASRAARSLANELTQTHRPRTEGDADGGDSDEKPRTTRIVVE